MAPLVRDCQPEERGTAAALVAAAGLPLDGWDSAAVVVVADHDGCLLGTAALERYKEPDGAAAWLLRSVAVDPRARGGAVGSGVIREALTRTGREPVALLTETAQN